MCMFQYVSKIYTYSGASLIWTSFIWNSIIWNVFGNQFTFTITMWFTYPEILLYKWSAWEQSCPDKWSTTVIQNHNKENIYDTMIYWSTLLHTQQLDNIWIDIFRENLANNGICVANHTSPIDVIVLSGDACYAMVSSTFMVSLEQELVEAIHFKLSCLLVISF